MPRSGIAAVGPLGLPADDARRASDAMSLALAVHGDAAINRWVAIRMSDGGSDGILYDRLTDALRHQLHPTQCMYLRVNPAGLPATEAAVLLARYRNAYAHGFRPDQLWAEHIANEQGMP